MAGPAVRPYLLELADFRIALPQPPPNMANVTDRYRCWAEVDLNALCENLTLIRNLAGPERKILTVVKADAYGHGLRQIAAVLMQSGTDLFGVANLAEARAIRAVGKGWPILMLGACLPFEVDSAVRDGVMPTLSSIEEAEAFSAAAVHQKKKCLVHLKVDTGMGRLGASPKQALALFDQVARLPGLTINGLYTHYSSAEDDPEFSAAQRSVFAGIAETLASQNVRLEWLHASSSGGLLLEPHEPCDTVRAGLLVYGVVPDGPRLSACPLRSRFHPALSWKCRVSLVREVPAGTPISYGHTFVTRKRTRIAILTAGYGDGYFRSGSNRAQVLIGGRRCPVLGRVTMDQTVVDVSELSGVQPADEAVLIGAQGADRITANELAAWCGTISWEVLTNITYRVPRVYRGSHAA
ncbi:MAG: alanine racemase [Verrucomicrobiia bacterium]